MDAAVSTSDLHAYVALWQFKRLLKTQRLFGSWDISVRSAVYKSSYLLTYVVSLVPSLQRKMERLGITTIINDKASSNEMLNR